AHAGEGAGRALGHAGQILEQAVLALHARNLASCEHGSPAPITPAMLLVTGGAGFIGSNLVAALEARGLSDIVVCDIFGDGDKWRNLSKRELAGIVPPQALFAFLDANAGKI